jgi:hypothetical protein
LRSAVWAVVVFDALSERRRNILPLRFFAGSNADASAGASTPGDLGPNAASSSADVRGDGGPDIGVEGGDDDAGSGCRLKNPTGRFVNEFCPASAVACFSAAAAAAAALKGLSSVPAAAMLWACWRAASIALRAAAAGATCCAPLPPPSPLVAAPGAPAPTTDGHVAGPSGTLPSSAGGGGGDDASLSCPRRDVVVRAVSDAATDIDQRRAPGVAKAWRTRGDLDWRYWSGSGCSISAAMAVTRVRADYM